ncbi:dTDP-4-dehydrorhamnose 3,5-epimerase family protein [Streptomyces sp. NPDC020858]|uniref:dTDP-4-dehydrorhamnose 3,5-epimerase family protein n=1 Tax=Streptomyces sp. NPDC020858 TaxID=3365097 RepID=UPI0037BA7CD7
MKPSVIEGHWVDNPSVHRDQRGSFHEWFRHSLLRDCTVSRRGSVRGIPYAVPGQAKSVACVYGSVLDVVVDIRVDSPTYGRWSAVRLDGGNQATVRLSEDLGRAFMALSEGAVVVYLASREYDPAGARAVCPLDPDLGIDGPLPPLLSEQDRNAPTLAEARENGLLPHLNLTTETGRSA